MEDKQPDKFGTIKGVLIPNITMMFGVILFLRLGVLAAHSGPWQMLGAIGLSLLIMVFTSFSIGSLATNMQVGTGGVYYIISRTLGVELGGAVGLAIYIAQLISIALTVSGFSVSFCELYPQCSLAIVELTTLSVLALFSGISASGALRLQGFILVLLLAAIGSVLAGSPANVEPLGGRIEFFYGTPHLGFWLTFALFYPAMTGIEAGMAMSGSLKNPGRSLYRGNLYALIFVAVCYAGMSLFALWRIPADVLISDPFSFVKFARYPWLVMAGIWGATLSSALGCLLAAPRILQSMADDGIVWSSLGRTFGSKEEPRVALGISYLLAGIILFFTTIDQIIPMLAMICLVSYGLLNLVTMFAALMNSPSWRPQLRTHWLISLAAVALIIIAMLMTAPGWAMVTLVILGLGYIVLRSRDLETSFHDLRESILFFVSRLTLYRLGQPTEHALTWHPQLLVLISAPSQQEKLVHLAHYLTRRSGILTFAAVVPEEWQSHERAQSARETLQAQLDQRQIACLAEVYPATSVDEGQVQLIKAYGIGPIQPNTVMLEVSEEDIRPALVDMIETCACSGKNVVLMKDSPGCSEASIIGKKRQRLDVWWDPDETTNFDLTMSLVTTLTDTKHFGGAPVTIKAEVSDRNAVGHVTQYLKTYKEKSRLKAKIVVSSKPIRSPKPSPIAFVSLRPLEPDEDKQEYMAYLKECFQTVKKGQLVLFVTSYDSVDHREIYYSSSNEE